MIIATRKLRLIGDEQEVEVPIAIHLPVEDDRAWRCDYEIGWPGEPRIFRAFGVDGVQALQLAMFAIGTDLWANPYHQADRLFFKEGDPSYGFPAEFPRQVGRGDR